MAEVLYQSGNVKLTSKVLSVNHTTVQVSNIGSLQLHRNRRLWLFNIGLVLILMSLPGGMIIYPTIGEDAAFFLAAAGFLGGIVLAILGVTLRGGGWTLVVLGPGNAMLTKIHSDNRQIIEEIQSAVAHAIAARD